MKTQLLPTKPLAIILVIAITVYSCVSTTIIQSVPDGANLYINEEPVGKTPYRYSDSKILGSSTEIRIEKDGYDTYYTQLVRLEEPDALAIVGAFFFLPAILWATKYKPSHSYYLIQNTDKEVKSEDQQENENPKIRELRIMLDNGMITKEVFEAEKNKIMKENGNNEK